MNDTTAKSISSFLDQDVDSLPDAPKREILPDGKHIVQVKEVKQDTLANKEALVVTYVHVTTEELVKPSDAAPKQGTEYQELFFTGTETGLGALKEFLKNVKKPGMKLGEIISALPGSQFRIVTKVRSWKNKTSGEMQEGHSTIGGLQLL